MFSKPTSLLRALLIAVVALMFVSTAAGCSSPATVEVGTDTTVIDVRTPAEYDSGHLEGAVNMDLESGAFEQQVSSLDPTADYVLYCRSGNRSAQAASIMATAGFDHVQDAGGLQAAADATGLPVVTG